MKALFTERRAEISCSGLEFKTTAKVRMIRIIVDSSHTTHGDLYLKIDVLPTYSKKGDSYYLFDFLEINEAEFKGWR